jgi:glycerol-3-phosphate acyltransferase PlsY
MIGNLLDVDILIYLTVPLAFLLGSIPFGILFTRNKGIDIRKTGSRNIGATNVLRSVGKIPAILTLLCDMLKGTLAVLICKSVISMSSSTPESSVLIEDMWLGITGIAAVLGHMFSLFLSFKGGKGVATGFGVILVYSPAVAGITLIIWILVALTFKYSSLAALIAISTMPILLAAFKSSSIKITIAVILAALVVYKHKSNIKDLMEGNESKIGNK